jgi:hypothetical protein
MLANAPWFLLVAYALVAIVISRPLIGHLTYWKFNARRFRARDKEPDGDDQFFGISVGVIMSILWGPILVGLASFKLYKLGTNPLPAVGAEKEFHQEQHVERLRKLDVENQRKALAASLPDDDDYIQG